MDSQKLRIRNEVSLMVGAALLLSFFKGFKMPQGGSATLEMLPILVLAFRRGGKIGMLGGALHGAIKLLLGPSYVHPIQILFDYPIPYAVVGIAGFGLLREKRPLGALVAVFLRYVVHVFAGVVFWGHYAPEGTPALLYSLTYNANYLAVEAALMIVLIHLLGRRREIFAPQSTD